MDYSSLLSRQSVLILGRGTGRFSVSTEDRHMAASEEKSILSISELIHTTLTKIHSSRLLSTFTMMLYSYTITMAHALRTQTTRTIDIENR